MSERNMSPMQIFEDGATIVALPTTYTGHFMKFSIYYILEPRREFCDRVSSPEITIHYKDGRACKSLSFIPDKTVLGNMNTVMRYIQYVWKHLGKENQKSIPVAFEEFLNEDLKITTK